MDTSERQRLIAVARTHAAAEAARDMATTLATLDDDPVYELQPLGRVMRGRDRAARYYEHFFTRFTPLVAGSTLRGEWITEEGLGQEYTIRLRHPDGTREAHNVIGILTFGRDDRLSGERVYASERLLRLMFGPLLDETEPLDPPDGA